MFDAVHVNCSFKELTKSGNDTVPLWFLLVRCITSHMRCWSFCDLSYGYGFL